MRPKDYGALAVSATSANVSYYNNILRDYTWLNPKKMPSATFSHNVALNPKNVPAGVNNTANA